MSPKFNAKVPQNSIQPPKGERHLSLSLREVQNRFLFFEKLGMFFVLLSGMFLQIESQIELETQIGLMFQSFAMISQQFGKIYYKAQPVQENGQQGLWARYPRLAQGIDEILRRKELQNTLNFILILIYGLIFLIFWAVFIIFLQDYLPLLVDIFYERIQAKALFEGDSLGDIDNLVQSPCYMENTGNTGGERGITKTLKVDNESPREISTMTIKGKFKTIFSKFKIPTKPTAVLYFGDLLKLKIDPDYINHPFVLIESSPKNYHYMTPLADGQGQLHYTQEEQPLPRDGTEKSCLGFVLSETPHVFFVDNDGKTPVSLYLKDQDEQGNTTLKKMKYSVKKDIVWDRGKGKMHLRLSS